MGFGPRAIDGGIDEVPVPGTPGRLWLCGKHVVGPDPVAAMARVGADTVVCLNERHELEPRYPDYVRWLLAEHGRHAVWFPVPDLHAPPVDEARALVEDLGTRLDAGARLLLHCGAGIGRAGTTAVGVLLRAGMSRRDALAHVRAHRPLAGPEAGAQEYVVDSLARFFGTE